MPTANSARTDRAPFAGRVESRSVEPGEQITPGQPVLRLVDVGRVKVVVGFGNQQLDEIKAKRAGPRQKRQRRVGKGAGELHRDDADRVFHVILPWKMWFSP